MSIIGGKYCTKNEYNTIKFSGVSDELTRTQIYPDGNILDREYNFPMGQPCLSVYKHGSFKWEPINNLSSSSFKDGRNTISEMLSEQAYRISILEKKTRKLQQIEDNFKEILENIPDDVQRKLYNSDLKLEIFNDYCPNCKNFGVEKKHCMFKDNCRGLCTDCFKIENNTCNACGSKQEKQCITCYQYKSLEQLCDSNNCQHSVCWDCRGRSCRAGVAMYQCPMCSQYLD